MLLAAAGLVNAGMKGVFKDLSSPQEPLALCHTDTPGRMGIA